ncbi:MAG: TldD/PmbA family protein [Candidatus Pelagibacter sp. TMED106]|jgi:PmbA protein|nr:MAG: TldD/PmbA family protein [Candidatus Pelagibacter sp. TMED106]|tara:strand:+ start:2575 stop:3891 length:1317 start_codon:yes stop_codon:yes gene_type:complete
MVKDKEHLKKKASFCIDFAKKLGATDASVTIMHSISETVNFRNKKLDESNRSDSLGISLVTYLDKKKSNITSSNLDEDNIKTLVERCIETTKNTPEDEFNSLPDKNLLARDFKNLDLYDSDHIENDKKIDYLKEAEESAFKNKEIINTETGFSETKSNFVLVNSDGFENGYKSSSFSASCVAVAKSNGSMERDYEFTNTCHKKDMMKASQIGSEAAKKALEKLNPRKIESEKINIIFDKRISKTILGNFARAISSASIARGTSFLKDKINKKIFSDKINIFDKPDIVKGLGSRYFDSEGVKNDPLKLVEQGILKHYLIDTYYGKKLNLQSNGRNGGSSNLFFESGDISFKDLLNLSSKNLYITETIGHGSNLVTGDYSVGANGFIVENGEFKYPVSEITIAGNFKDIFNNMTLADDLEFKYKTNSPTMLIEGMVVAGK